MNLYGIRPLESATPAQNAYYLEKVLRLSGSGADADRFVAPPPKVNPFLYLESPVELRQIRGIVAEQSVEVDNIRLKLKIFDTPVGYWTPRLFLCRVLGRRESFLSRLSATANHSQALAKAGYTGKFRKVEDMENGGAALKCISLKDAKIAIAVLGVSQEVSDVA